MFLQPYLVAADRLKLGELVQKQINRIRLSELNPSVGATANSPAGVAHRLVPDRSLSTLCVSRYEFHFTHGRSGGVYFPLIQPADWFQLTVDH